MKKENNEVLKEKIYELYNLNNNLKAMQDQLKLFDDEFSELKRIKESLEDFQSSEEKEVFNHLGGGIFVKAELNEKNKVLLNVGGNVLVYKDVKEAKRLIEEQTIDIQTIMERLDQEINQWAIKVNSLEKEIEDLNKDK